MVVGVSVGRQCSSMTQLAGPGSFQQKHGGLEDWGRLGASCTQKQVTRPGEKGEGKPPYRLDVCCSIEAECGSQVVCVRDGDCTEPCTGAGVCVCL